MIKVPFVDLKWQHNKIKNPLKKRFEEIFAKTAFIGGEDCEIFEKKFAKYLGVKNAIGVASGTDALTLALKVFGISKGDEVLTIPTTFFATAGAIAYTGAKPVFVDINPQTRDFDFDSLARSITRRTKAIIPVHLYGQSSNLNQVLKLAKTNNLKVIEDACQSHGAEYQGKKLGTFGDLGCFSFYPGKNLGAYGDGGIIVTRDDSLAERLRQLRNYGGIAKYEHNHLGYNSRLDTLQAAVLDEKLKHLDDWNKKRGLIAKIYDRGLSGIKEIQTFTPLPKSKAVYHLYVIKLLSGNRADLMAYLKEKGIASGIHYPEPLHLLAAFRGLGYKKGDFPAAEEYCQNIVSLPIFPGMTKGQASYVIKMIRSYFTAGNKRGS